MRIALLAHLRHPVAPPFMGGMEAHSWHLANALARRGHDVTLFASGDSAADLPDGVHLFPVLDSHYDAIYPWHAYRGTAELNNHLDMGFTRACRHLMDGGYDIIHNNTLHERPPRTAHLMGLPMVTSLHVPPFAALARSVRNADAPWCRYTVTSARQAGIWWPDGMPAGVDIVHNGIDPAAWPYRPGGDGSAVWAGRITETKGAAIAAKAAIRAGIPVTLYGAIENDSYFQGEVVPLLSDQVRYGGHVKGEALANAYASASVLLFTPLWEEPFGLSAVEAMATGLPVAALPMGAVHEVIGEAGCIAERPDVDALSRTIPDALRIPPARAHARAVKLFTIDRMVGDYERCYAAARHGLRTKFVRRAIRAA